MLNIGSLNRIFLCWELGSTPICGRQRLSRVLRGAVCCVLCGAIALFGFTSSAFAHSLASPVFTRSLTSFGPASSALSLVIVQVNPAQTAIDSVDIAAEKVDQFAQAYLQVLQLLSDREAEIPAAETTAEALKIEQSIEFDALKIIQDSGLTTPEYMQILGLASQDSAFQDKVLGRMDESAEDS